jgi:hypothetical protein
MKKVLLLTLLAFSLALASFGLVSEKVLAACPATSVLCSGGSGSPCANPNAAGTVKICADDSTGSKNNPITGPNGLLTKITNIVLYIVGAFAVIMVIVSGIRMATSNGDEQGFKSARTGLIYALIGLAVAILARAIVLFIIGRI